METSPQWALVVGSAVTGVIGIGWSAVTAFQRGFGKFETQKDKAAESLVSILQTTVNELKEQVKELQTQHVENLRELSQLRGENSTLMKILQGRDEMSIKFQTEGFAAFARINSMADGMEHLATALEAFLKTQGVTLK